MRGIRSLWDLWRWRTRSQRCPRCDLCYPVEAEHCPHCHHLDDLKLVLFRASVEEDRRRNASLGRTLFLLALLVLALMFWWSR